MNPTCFKVKLALLMIVSCLRIPAAAQNTINSATIDVAKIKTAILLKDSAYWHTEKGDVKDPRVISNFRFEKKTPNVKDLSLIDKNLYLKFRLQNSHDTTIRLYFHPGYYYKEIKLFAYDHTSKRFEAFQDTSA